MPADADTPYDVVVLGGGSGGYACALRAAQLGLSVALVEKDKLGGTCLHDGCIPTKALLHAAEVADSAREGSRSASRRPSIGRHERRARLQGRRRRPALQGLQGLVKAADRLRRGHGQARSAPTPSMSTAAASPAATSCWPPAPTPSRCRAWRSAAAIMTSDEALTIDHVPASVIVLGGGVIGVEFASVWKSFGSDVTIVEALPRLVAAEDEAISKQLRARLPQARIAFNTGVRFAGARQDGDVVTVTLEDGDTSRPTCARRRRPRPEHGRARLRGGRRHRRSRLRADRRAAPHQRAQRLRRRRHRPRAAARAPRLPAGHLRGRGDRRAHARADRRAGHPAGHLLRPRDRLRRPDRGPGQGEVRRRSRPTSTTSAATASARSSRRRASSSSSARRTARSSACT